MPSRSLLPTYKIATALTTDRWVNKGFKSARTSKCQNPRQRWPEIEAVIQVIFRVIALLLHIAAGAIVLYNADVFDALPFECYAAISYCLSVTVVEIASLTAPPLPCWPHRRFPRLPSSWLTLVEFIAIAMVVYSMFYLLQPLDIEDHSCPKETCIQPDEVLFLKAYGCQMSTLVIHIGFFCMSLTHWLKRKVPQWMDYWGI
ncbi:hypothetical protein CC78DRAFT_587368 [Lojkania enalia]|uniref:Uncharacterized protein n=1 Tax=Lojkania enalia TaxID=147567 RepID=A0A9P4JXI8_9PLEO|nr:hypothetical protein CC78DRAFT_587368 [Didymosphaeria enalia]